MDKTNIEAKYQKLATEYSKVRSQATVLKKAVLDEQAKNIQFNEINKKLEQQIRKHDQEMESLTFRNEQLTKRIGVLQQELHETNHGKKNKSKTNYSTTVDSDIAVLNEELHKRIIENAQLNSSISDKECELSEYAEKIDWLESKLRNAQIALESLENTNREEVDKLRNDKIILQKKINNIMSEKSLVNCEFDNRDTNNKVHNNINLLHEEINRWKTECDVLRSRPSSNKQLTDYYETQLAELVETKSLAISETHSILAENVALSSRVESLILDLSSLESLLGKNIEELTNSNDNYKAQLDALTEHLAVQNEKITKQCDEIEILKYKLQQIFFD
ncbi:unnamed protein product [Brassicogethes aeneus]|uniref:Protein phosphatase 1 regulatory subunit 21 N-terminal domain-containing protein n=1 Tax=Brassicogethes aeneus TaxID=1431903 RepID=A0A9P0FN06_BRAAE|nr:unnamed protein product [Brassicogethes aeneus]